MNSEQRRRALRVILAIVARVIRIIDSYRDNKKNDLDRHGDKDND